MTTTAVTPGAGLDAVAELAAQLRVDSVRSSTSAGSGHPTSSMSAADLLAVLVTRHLRYDWDDPRLAANDHLIFSKGHASPLLYSVFKAVGVVSEEELMTGYRRFGQRLEGHPTPVLPWVDVATGSLGQGLPDGVGVALAGKYLDRLPYRVWVLCGDSELAEGSIWEALDKASHYSCPTWSPSSTSTGSARAARPSWAGTSTPTPRRAEAFGARVLVIDGHDLAAIDGALAAAEGGIAGGQATVILAKTIKGRGFSEVEDKEGWHGRPFPPDMAERAIAELGGIRNLMRARPAPGAGSRRHQARPRQQTLARHRLSTPSATRWPPAGPTGTRWSPWAPATRRSSPWTARSRTPPSPSSSPRPTRTGTSRCSSPSSRWSPPPPAWPSAATDRSPPPSPRSSPVPMTSSGWAPSPASTCGWRARTPGVEIGADGPSQMALEDLAMMRAVHGSTVLYPADGTSTAALVEAMAGTAGISYLRTTRGAYPGLYPAGRGLPRRRLQGAPLRRARRGDPDRRRRHPARMPARRGQPCTPKASPPASSTATRIKPIDTATLAAAAQATGGRIVIAEDHHPEGGLGSAVTDALLAAGQQRPVRRAPRGPRDARLRDRAGAARLGRHRRRPHRRRRPPAGQQQMMSHHDPWPDRPEPTW